MTPEQLRHETERFLDSLTPGEEKALRGWFERNSGLAEDELLRQLKRDIETSHQREVLRKRRLLRFVNS